MEAVTHTDIHDFLATAGTFLAADPVNHSVHLTTVDMATRGERTPATLITLHDNGTLIGAVTQMRDRPLHVAAMPPAAAPLVAKTLRGQPIDAVTGPLDRVEAFRTHWLPDGRETYRLRLYRLATLTSPTTPGTPHLVSPAEPHRTPPTEPNPSLPTNASNATNRPATPDTPNPAANPVTGGSDTVPEPASGAPNLAAANARPTTTAEPDPPAAREPWLVLATGSDATAADESHLTPAQYEDLITDWWVEFVAELDGLSRHDAEQVMRDARDMPAGHVVWLVDGVPVAWAATTAPVGGVSRVGPVYTPPEHRRRGYAAAVTAAVCRWARRAGAEHVVLTADLANPTANSVYLGIGFQAVSDWSEYRW